MKKILFTILILSIILGMNSCEPEDEDENPFIGTWEQVYNNKFQIVFTEEKVTAYYYEQDLLNDIYYTGTYIYDDDKITVFIDFEKSAPEFKEVNELIYTYEFKNEKLFLTYFTVTEYKRVQ